MGAMVTREQIKQNIKEQITAISTSPQTFRANEEIPIRGPKTGREYIRYKLSDITLNAGKVIREIMALEVAA